MELRSGVAFAVLVLATVCITQGNAIHCWLCSAPPGSKYNCSSVENNPLVQKENCGEDFNKCVKTVIQNSDGTLDISRSCEADKLRSTGCVGDVRNMNCVCEGELCNGSRRAESGFGVSVALALAVALARVLG